jgi:signal transduction histidine kinase
MLSERRDSMRHAERHRRLRAFLKCGVRVTGTTFLLLGLLFLIGLLPGGGRGEEGLSVVQASDGDLWSSLLDFPLAYAVVVVLVLILVVGVVYWRTAYLERTRERLKQQVAERTREVERQKHQLMVYNRELLRTNDQLRQTVEEKSKLLGVAAHDLKNPLFGIRALSETVLENEEMTPRIARKLNLIRESADEAMALIDDLLTSAANSAQTQVKTEPVDLVALTQWVVHSFEPHAQRKDQDLHCSVTDGTCVVTGDKRRLREAIGNLVSNALKYSPPGTDVDVSVHHEGDAVAVEVADEGPGLSADDQNRLFAAFQRLTPTPTGGESSSGLGLYIVKQVVDLHGGNVAVDSTVGAGSTFRISLPVAERDVESLPRANPPEVEQVA